MIYSTNIQQENVQNEIAIAVLLFKEQDQNLNGTAENDVLVQYKY